MQMAVSVVANQFLAMERREHQNPDPSKTGRVGHPERPNQSLGVDVPEWYDPTVSVRQQKKCERVGHPPVIGSKPRLITLSGLAGVVSSRRALSSARKNSKAGPPAIVVIAVIILDRKGLIPSWVFGWISSNRETQKRQFRWMLCGLFS